MKSDSGKSAADQKARDAEKRAAGVRSVDFVRSGMAVGLGTGSTARFVAEELAARLQDGRLRDIVCVPTSSRTRDLAESLGIALTTLDERESLDIAIDGADEVDPDLNLIKGAGGALLHEKIVAAAARQFVVVADESKLVHRLGEHAGVPIEVVRFGWKPHLGRLEALGCRASLRTAPSGEPFLTDEGNFILDARFGDLSNPAEVDRTVKSWPGVVETGLFLNMADVVVVGRDGGTRMIGRPDSGRLDSQP